ncbi:hypothetical protein [Novosphingobium sp. CECT 9465]|uniref:hypothetical protein n=1 Tax=Novosphingobium sp. CECT 9465 TaxID=2829794 RepID=UPI001E562950|nr:hypothetical protein [Novosphingobium sp. CECT 9465]
MRDWIHAAFVAAEPEALRVLDAQLRHRERRWPQGQGFVAALCASLVLWLGIFLVWQAA